MTFALRTAMVPLLVVSLGSCNVGLRPGDDSNNPEVRCAAGVDIDSDGLQNDVECMLGTDPYNPDTDMDGVTDGSELSYPKVCVSQDPATQRRPPAGCQSDNDCQSGERCAGIDPTEADSDGDGVPDGMEDLNRDGSIDIGRGESDPRLYDTDGDGRNDSMSGLDICRPSGLGMVTQAGVPAGTIQLGHDPQWGNAVPVVGTGQRGALLLDDAAAGVAGAVFTVPAMGDIRAEATRLEGVVTGALGGATAVLTGRALTTHEMFPAVISTYRVARNTSASALRDATVDPLVGAAAPAGAAVGASSEFLVDITTILRTAGAGMRSDVIVTVAPRSLYEDATKPAVIRAGDLANSTAIAEAGKMIGSGCQVFKAEGFSTADFLWAVDTSGSMSDDQERLGNTALKFFERLKMAGVDFRVGVVQAGSSGLNLDAPGFKFISGNDPMGPLQLCREVTTTACPMGGAESLRPYLMSGSEEPTAASIIGHNAFKQRAMMGEMNMDRRFRPGARVVSFFVTDEPGTNDFSRYFQGSKDPETGMAWGNGYNAATLDNIIGYFKRNQILTFGLVQDYKTVCANADQRDLPRCVIEGNGGAIIPIVTASDAEVAAAMNKIVDAVAGATSQFHLDRSPITSTIKVRVRGMDVPRSRSEGFDYDPASRSVVFYGNQLRPQKGDEVVISYRVWEGSLG